MKKLKTLPLLLFAFVGLPVLLEGQTSLTWEACLKEAAVHNPDLLAAEQTLKAADNAKIASLGQFLPQVSFGASVGRSGPGNSLEGALSDPNYGQNASLSLSARQDIFSGFKDISSVDTANAQLDIARAQFGQAKSQLSHDLKQAFYQLLFSQNQITLLEDIAKRNLSNENLVELNYKSGTDNKGSLLQARAGRIQADYEVKQARRALSVAQQQVAQLLGRDKWDGLLAEGSFTVPSDPADPGDFRQLVLKTPGHLQALARLHLSEGQFVTARSAFLPTLAASASLSRSGDTFDSLDNQGWSAGLNLSFPLFSGGQDLFNFKSAEESKRGAEETLRSSDFKNALQLQSAFAAYQDAVEKTAVQEAYMKASEIREQIGKAEYLNGLLNFQNWDLLESDLTNQQKSDLQSLLNAKDAEANWELAQGKGEIK